MTDVQLLTLALAIIVPLSLLIYSNSRVTEAKETLRAEMALGFERITNQINGLREEIQLLTGKVIEIDNRLSRIEDRIGPPR
jgi:uncharacterized protein YoxC